MERWFGRGWGWVAALAVASAVAAPVEIGTVRWGTDLDAGLAEARRGGRPVFLLFQEVPGCSGCQDFGRAVLSDGRMVRAIEAHFVPVFIANNRPGREAGILRQFGEPAWNYQVVRFLDGQGRDLIPRKDRVWDTETLAARMVQSLETAGRPVDDALRRLAGLPAASTPAPEEAAFAQACFWTGEMRLGQIEGVIRTEAGFIGGREVTRVAYDPARITFPQLVRAARARGVADQVYAATEAQRAGIEGGAERLDASYRKAPESDQKKQLQGTPAEHWTLTPEEATKVNAFIRTDPRRAAGFVQSKP
jgi:hypothetical protein